MGRDPQPSALNQAKRFPGARWERAGLCLFHLNKANEAAAYLKSLRDEISEVEIAAAPVGLRHRSGVNQAARDSQ